MEKMKRLFVKRLGELVPALEGRGLHQLGSLGVEDGLRSHGLNVPWSWEAVGTLGELLACWSLDVEEVVFVASPESGAVRQVKVGDVAQEPLQAQDTLVVGRDVRCLGIFDAQFRHACLHLPRLFPDPLHFYSTTDAFGAFSNFASFPIRVDGVLWPTTEHYFQAQKFVGTPHEDELRRARTPMEVARMGRQRRRPLRKDWDSVRIEVMRRALQAKFTQHEELRELLVATHPSKLVEHTTNDAFWGDGGDGRGQNWLGRLLMELREVLRGG